MGRYPVFAIVALIFIGIIKLLQATVFDADQYGKYRKMSFTSIEGKKSSSKQDEEAIADTKTEITSFKSKIEDDTIQIQSDTTKIFDKKTSFTEDINEEKRVETIPTQSKSLEELKRNYLDAIVAELPAGQLREDIVVRYYRHDKDGDKVYALKDLGYYIHEKEATETADLGSNTLFYGEDVPIEDIKIIAYTLINQGLPLKAIEPTQFSWKSTSLEVGTDTLLLDKSILTTSDIQNFSK